jgi:hypothetical protein
MGLNVRLYNITNDGTYAIRYKSGDSPYPETNDSTFTLYNTGLTATTITISGLSFDTQYWIKMTDHTTGRYIIKNIYTHDSKAFPCYDTLCFDVQTFCPEPSPSPTPTPTTTPTTTPTNTPTPTRTPSVTPTPSITLTNTPTPTRTPSLTPTPSPTYKSWSIQQCETPCVSAQCGCGNQVTTTVYTLPNVNLLTDPGVVIYTNSTLTTIWSSGFFSQGGVIYEVSAGTATNYCDVGIDPC